MQSEVNASKGDAEKVEALYKEQDELLGKPVSLPVNLYMKQMPF